MPACSPLSSSPLALTPASRGCFIALAALKYRRCSLLAVAMQSLQAAHRCRVALPHLMSAASRTCDLTGKRANNGYVVTFSHKRNKKLQQVNLQYKKVYWPEGQR